MKGSVEDERRRSKGSSVARQEVASHVGFLLSRAHSRFRLAMQEAIAGSGLHLGHIAVLGALSASSPLSQRELTDLTGIEKSSMVLVIDALEALNHVRRSPHPDDRRAHAVELTAEGIRLLRRIGPRLDAAENALLDGFAANERRALVALLRRFTDDGR